MSDSGSGNGPIKPDVEIAWARAIARAFDDPAYYRRLKANPAAVLSELGADVSGIDVTRKVNAEDSRRRWRHWTRSTRISNGALRAEGGRTIDVPAAFQVGVVVYQRTGSIPPIGHGGVSHVDSPPRTHAGIILPVLLGYRVHDRADVR